MIASQPSPQLPADEDVETRFILDAVRKVKSPWLRYLLSLEIEALAQRYADLEAHA